MSKTLLVCALLVWGCGPFSSLSNVAAQEAKTPKVLLIGIDGLRPDAMQAATTPHLDALVKSGAYADNTQILSESYLRSDTVSGPGWSSIRTGVWARKHGVHDNSFRGSNDAFPHLFARVKEVRPQAQTASFATWPQIAEKIVSGADVNELIQVEGDSANHYLRAEGELTEKAEAYLKDETADITFVYYGLVDTLGHTKGFHPQVPEYILAIDKIDLCVGKLLAALAARKTYAEEDRLILVGTDHGGRGRNHDRGHDVPEIRNVFFIASGLSAARGKIDEPTSIVDFVPTSLTHLGIPIADEWKLDGRAVGLSKPQK